MDLFMGELDVQRCLTRGCRVQLMKWESKHLGLCEECRARNERIRLLIQRVYCKRKPQEESVAESRGKAVGAL